MQSHLFTRPRLTFMTSRSRSSDAWHFASIHLRTMTDSRKPSAPLRLVPTKTWKRNEVRWCYRCAHTSANYSRTVANLSSNKSGKRWASADVTDVCRTFNVHLLLVSCTASVGHESLAQLIPPPPSPSPICTDWPSLWKVIRMHDLWRHLQMSSFQNDWNIIQQSSDLCLVKLSRSVSPICTISSANVLRANRPSELSAAGAHDTSPVGVPSWELC